MKNFIKDFRKGKLSVEELLEKMKEEDDMEDKDDDEEEMEIDEKCGKKHEAVSFNIKKLMERYGGDITSAVEKLLYNTRYSTAKEKYYIGQQIATQIEGAIDNVIESTMPYEKEEIMSLFKGILDQLKYSAKSY